MFNCVPYISIVWMGNRVNIIRITIYFLQRSYYCFAKMSFNLPLIKALPYRQIGS
jgi:hypothetical protein